MRGMPVIVLTSAGAKSDDTQDRMRVEHNGQYAMVASWGGALSNPVWYHITTSRRTSTSSCTLQNGAVKRDYLAGFAGGEERDLWCERVSIDLQPETPLGASASDFNADRECRTRSLPDRP